MDAPAIQNLEYLRRLIEEIKASEEPLDEIRLRMLRGSGMGFDAVSGEEV